MSRPMTPGEYFENSSSEFCWGRGLGPAGSEDRNLSPRDGGRYQPISPPEEFVSYFEPSEYG